MPTLCRFYGLVIRMYLRRKEHNPPHIHVIYGEEYAAIKIDDGEIMEGDLPPKALAMAKEWVMKNKTDLLEMWNTNQFKPLEPLK